MKLFAFFVLYMFVLIQCTPKTEKTEKLNTASVILKTVCLQYVRNENDIVITHILSDSTLRFKDRDHVRSYERINDSLMIENDHQDTFTYLEVNCN